MPIWLDTLGLVRSVQEKHIQLYPMPLVINVKRSIWKMNMVAWSTPLCLFLTEGKDPHQKEGQCCTEERRANRDQDALIYGIGYGLGNDCHKDASQCK